MKKRLLFVYTKMVIGGSTTSLISILDNIDYDQYDVDLLLSDNTGELQKNIPEKVNLIQSDNILEKKKKYEKVLSISFLFNYIYSIILSKKYSNNLVIHQVRSKYQAKHSKPINKNYEIAIAFLEFWPTNYVAYKVDARKKITWLHLDYLGTKLVSKIDYDAYRQFDKIITVSDQCSTNLKSVFPTYQNKILAIKNILSQNTIRTLSNQQQIKILDSTGLKIVTVCRISFDSKGLDRGVKAFARLRDENVLTKEDIWYIIGDGPDMVKLKEIITINRLNDNIKLLGSKENPHIYVKHMDLFFLPSRYEGMPMAVTEAQMLGVVPCVTNYSSATHQIANGIDGIIMENSDEGIYECLKNIINGCFDLDIMKKNLLKNDYSNLEEMDRINEIL